MNGKKRILTVIAIFSLILISSCGMENFWGLTDSDDDDSAQGEIFISQEDFVSLVEFELNQTEFAPGDTLTGSWTVEWASIGSTYWIEYQLTDKPDLADSILIGTRNCGSTDLMGCDGHGNETCTIEENSTYIMTDCPSQITNVTGLTELDNVWFIAKACIFHFGSNLETEVWCDQIKKKISFELE